jgi:hypothetical protein
VIERLIDSLRLLAAPAEQPHAQAGGLADGPHAPAREFADAFMLICDCPQIRLTPTQQRSLDEVDTLLQQMAEDETAASARWSAVRQAASTALRALGDSP